MSVDSSTGGSDSPSQEIACSLCGQGVEQGDRFLTCYPGDEESVLSRAGADGTLALCSACTAEVDDLVDAWSDHDAPPVDADWSIHAGYDRATDDCSFCDQSLEDGVGLGVEYYRHDAAQGDAVATSANYSLCSGCTSIFDEFLAVVGDENV